MIHKDDLKGNYVTYTDRDGKWRTEKVIKIAGNYLTVRTTVKIKTMWKFPKRRIHLSCVKGRQHRKRGLEEIEWNWRRLPKRKKRL